MSVDHNRWSIGSGNLGRIDERGHLMHDSEEHNVGLNLDDLHSESDGEYGHQGKTDGFDSRPLKREDQ